MKNAEAENEIPEAGKWRQFIATLIINLLTLTGGISAGWTSPMIPQLLDKNTPVGTDPMTEEEISWLTSVICIAPLASIALCGFLAERFGRKITGCIVAVPAAVGWLLIILADDFYWLLVARILAGAATGMTLVLVPLYVAEISCDSVRGQFGTLMVFSLNFGMFLAFVFGATLSYQAFAICGIVVPVLFFGAFVFMPETPTYLVRKERVNEAIGSLMWLRNNEKTIVDREIIRLQEMVRQTAVTSTAGLKDLFRDRGTIKGFIISFTLLPGQQTTGYSAVFMYTATIFELAGSTVSPYNAAIILAAVQVLATWVSSMAIERVGRRLLLLISCAGMVISHIVLGLFFLFQTREYDVTVVGWLPVAALSVFTVAYCIGLGPVSFVVASEIFSADIATIANGISMAFLWIFCFLVVKFFPLLSNFIGNYGCFFLFAFASACTFAITYVLLPETRGKTIESILDELNGKAKGEKSKSSA